MICMVTSSSSPFDSVLSCANARGAFRSDSAKLADITTTGMIAVHHVRGKPLCPEFMIASRPGR